MAEATVVQLVIVPHRPVHSDAIIDADLSQSVAILKSAPGVISCWRGRKFEERSTRVFVVLWKNLEASHTFLTSPAYKSFHQAIQPAMNGRRVEWLRHARIGKARSDSYESLVRTLKSPAIEVAWTMVVEGGVSGYYERFASTVTPILDEDAGCDGHFISPSVENPHAQMLLINWKSVDAHHEDFEHAPGFKACIDALFDYYDVFVVPWHIVGLEQI